MSAQDNVELWESGPIHAAFPIKVGTMTYTEIQGHCAFCNQLIQPDYFRGKVTRVLPEVVEVRAVGICTDCQKASLFHYRLESDATFSGKNQDGKWARWSMKPEHQKTPAWKVWGLLLVTTVWCWWMLST